MSRTRGLPRTGGRKPGTKTRVSREWKELVRSICADPEAQERLRRACIERPELMFKAAEHAFGKPMQRVETKVEGGYSIPEVDAMKKVLLTAVLVLAAIGTCVVGVVGFLYLAHQAQGGSVAHPVVKSSLGTLEPALVIEPRTC